MKCQCYYPQGIIAYGIGGFLLALIPTLIWRIYCASYERSNYFASAFDSTANNIKAHTFTFTEDLPGYAISMLKAWLGQPLHITNTCGLNLTPLAAALLVIFLCWYCTKIGILKKISALRFGVLYVTFVIVYMMMLLFMHAYIFGENGYLNPEIMIYSVGRYTEPLFMGTFVYFIALILRKKEEQKLQLKRCLIVAAAIFMCSSIELAKSNIIDYTEMNAQANGERTAVMEQEPVAAFTAEVDTYFTEKDPARILWISDSEDTLAKSGQARVFWNIFAPKTYAYYQVSTSDGGKEDLAETIKNQVNQFKYIVLAIIQGALSAVLVSNIVALVGSPFEVPTKIIVDTLLFVASFYIQREFVFKNTKI